MDRIATLQAMEREKPKDAFVQYALALEYKNCGDVTQSRLYFEKLVTEFADYVPTYYHYAGMEAGEGNASLAIQLYEKGIEKAMMVNDSKTVRELKSAQELIVNNLE